MCTLALTAATTTNIAGSGNLTISSMVSGTSALSKSGAGELVLSGANTFSGGVTLSAGTLTVSNNAGLGPNTNNMTLSGGTLKLNSVGVTLGTLSVTGNSVIDFAGTSTLTLSTLTISTGVTLTINNWTSSDTFSVTTWTNASRNTGNVAPMNQVVFSGYPNLDTQWLSNNQIAPVPEPSTYGAILVGGLGTAFWWRRRRAAAKA